MWPIGGIFAYSGGTQVNVDAINAAPVHAVDESSAGAAMVRNEPSQPPRDAPHNLYGLGSGPVRARRRPGTAAAPVPVPAQGRAAAHRPGRARRARGLRCRLRPDLDVGRRHRHVEAGDRRRAPDRRRRGADRPGQRGGAVHRSIRWSPTARPSARATPGSSPTAPCASVAGCAPTRPSPRTTSTTPGAPILAAARAHLGGAAPRGRTGRRDPRAAARHHGPARHDRGGAHDQEEEVAGPRKR